MIHDMIITDQQQTSLEDCIEFATGHFVDLVHVQDEEDCYKAFFKYEENKVDSIYFNANFGVVVSNFEEKTF